MEDVVQKQTRQAFFDKQSSLQQMSEFWFLYLLGG